MALLLKHGDVVECVTMSDAIDAMEAACVEEADKQVILPPRINMKAGAGWLRVGPVSMERAGWAGFKAMNLAPGNGVRYQVHLYRIASGELLAIMDAQHLTTLRTGACSAVAMRRLARDGSAKVALLGAGVEAVAQLQAAHALGVVQSAKVFSPTPANRERLADQFRRDYEMDIRAVETPEAAVSGADIVLAAVKSTQVAFRGAWLTPGMHVCSVGTARRDQREIDTETFERSDIIVVDTREGVFNEAGDAIAAQDLMKSKVAHELCDLVAGKVAGRTSDGQVTLFKSVGTGIQDIALAAVVYERALAKGLGIAFEGFPIAKKA